MTIHIRKFQTAFENKTFEVRYKIFKGVLLAPEGFNVIINVYYNDLPLDPRELRDSVVYRELYEHLTNAMMDNAMSYSDGGWANKIADKFFGSVKTTN